MITFYAPGQSGVQLTDKEQCPELTRTAVWIDLLEPTKDEEKTLEASLGLNIPTRAEMQEIELSSRLYAQNGVLFLTATVLTQADTAQPESTAVTFMLMSEKLVTLRYADPAPFRAFVAKRETDLARFQTNFQFFAGLIDAIIERVADILENVGAHLDTISLRVFNSEEASATARLHANLEHSAGGQRRRARQRNFVEVLQRIGAVSNLVSRARESLISFSRLVAFFREACKETGTPHGPLGHWKTVTGDLNSLSDHASFLSTKVSFLLDATLGMINNEQNAIIKILSVAALVFLPPTLVAGVYGMNFRLLPELNWEYGYPFALILMLISAVLPYLVFRRRGWL